MPGMMWYLLIAILMFIGLFLAVPSDGAVPPDSALQSSANLSTKF